MEYRATSYQLISIPLSKRRLFRRALMCGFTHFLNLVLYSYPYPYIAPVPQWPSMYGWLATERVARTPSSIHRPLVLKGRASGADGGYYRACLYLYNNVLYQK